MKNKLILLTCFGLTVLLHTGLRAGKGGDWEYLFNGKDLAGWIQLNGYAHFAVVDGAIVGTTVLDSPNSFLATERTFSDFVIEYEVKQVGAVKSGLQFRSSSTPEYMNGRVHGYQCEIDPSLRAWTGGIYEEAGRRWIYPVDINPSAKTLYRIGEWNHFRIEAIGNSMRTWVNGIAVAHIIDDQAAEGFFALQVHGVKNPEDAGQKIYLRNIRIKTSDLTPSPLDDIYIRNLIPNHLSEQEKALGWKMLWDGKSKKGWRGAHMDHFPDYGWKIENGELIVMESGGLESRHGGDIVTEREYSAFELVLDFKLTPGANSGIKYLVTEQYGMKSGSAIGLEYQILDDKLHPDGKKGAAGNRTLASLYDLIPSYKKVSYRKVPRGVGVWHHARLIVRPDNTVQHWLDGLKVVEFKRGSPTYNAIVARSKYKDWENFGVAESGHILLQDHGNEVYFRSIKIREL